MKKISAFIVLIIIAGLVIWRFNGPSGGVDNGDKKTATSTIPTSQTVSVSTNMSEYKNDELGFSVKYPTNWEKTESPTNVSFFVPIDTKEKNTVNNIESKIDIISGKCAFPLVTTIRERTTLAVGSLNFNMISLANTVSSRNFFNRMYSLQKDSICYFFTFSAVTSSPTSKGLVGVDAQKASAKNTTLVDAADTQFKDMVKSFKFVSGPVGQDETKVAPKK